MTESLRNDLGPVYEADPEALHECGIRMAESAIRIERWRKKGKVRRDHDLVTVLLSLGVIEDEAPEHAERRKRSDVMASIAQEENQWPK